MTPAGETDRRQLPLSQFRRVLEVCDRFEAALRAGESPLLDDYLGGSEDVERSVLLSELRALEEAYRDGVPTSRLDEPSASKAWVPGGLGGGGGSGEIPSDFGSGSFGRRHEATDDDIEVLEELGRGGMGVVYRARQVVLDRVVALKMINAEDHADPRYRSRFRTEAQAVARLSHPNIVQIYEIGERDGRPYFAMEFVDGGSLARKLRGGPLPIRQAAQIVECVARAMHVAHGRGIVHRDLKPANILLTLDGQPKVTDFGLAKVNTGFGVGQSVHGMILGTPMYMAPEQAGGQVVEVGPAADIHALGATLYEMLTGQPPFRGATPVETLNEVLRREPLPPRRLRSLPRDLETICLKCLEKDPKRRYPSAEALADDLHAFLGGAPIVAQADDVGTRALRWARRNPLMIAIFGVALMGLVGLAVETWWSHSLAIASVGFLGLVGGKAWSHTRLLAAQRALGDQQVAAERYAERVHLLGEMTRRLMSVTDRDRLLYLLGETAARLANAELATIFLIDRERGEIWSKVTLDAGVGEIRIPLGVGIAGTVAVSGETIHIPDAYADPRFNPAIDRRTGYKTRNLLTFPMVGRDGQVLGVFQVLNKRDGGFEPADEAVLASLAASAALAVETARSRPESRPARTPEVRPPGEGNGAGNVTEERNPGGVR